MLANPRTSLLGSPGAACIARGSTTATERILGRRCATCSLLGPCHEPSATGPATDHEAATRPAETGPTITATLADGPLEGSSIEVELVEGRPPKTIDMPDNGSTCRYCLADWVQSGRSAAYTFLYRV